MLPRSFVRTYEYMLPIAKQARLSSKAVTHAWSNERRERAPRTHHRGRERGVLLALPRPPTTTLTSVSFFFSLLQKAKMRAHRIEG